MLWIDPALDIATVCRVQLLRESLLSRLVHTAWLYPLGRGQLHQTHHLKALELSLYTGCIPVLGLVCKLRPNMVQQGLDTADPVLQKSQSPGKLQQPQPTPSTFHGNTPSPHTGNTPDIPWATSSGTNDNYRLHRSCCKWLFVLQQHPGTPVTGQDSAVPSLI